MMSAHSYIRIRKYWPSGPLAPDFYILVPPHHGSTSGKNKWGSQFPNFYILMPQHHGSTSGKNRYLRITIFYCMVHKINFAHSWIHDVSALVCKHTKLVTLRASRSAFLHARAQTSWIHVWDKKHIYDRLKPEYEINLVIVFGKWKYWPHFIGIIPKRKQLAKTRTAFSFSYSTNPYKKIYLHLQKSGYIWLCRVLYGCKKNKMVSDGVRKCLFRLVCMYKPYYYLFTNWFQKKS